MNSVTRDNSPVSVPVSKKTTKNLVWNGGNGLEEFVRRNFSRDPVLILDFYHASEYLTELGQLLYTHDDEERKRVVGDWCQTLKRAGGQRVIEVLQTIPVPKGKAAKTKHAETLNYFQNNVHRMDYPTYVANGWSIGSGAVESACKTVVGQRLKLAGMRWREYGTETMCHLRALYKGEASQWQAFWRRDYSEGAQTTGNYSQLYMHSTN